MGHRIGEAATLSGLPATTIRYYEDEGLIPPADRTTAGHRVYDDRDVARLRFVHRARTLGMPVDDLADLVRTWEADRCGEVADHLADMVDERLDETQHHISELVTLAGELQRARTRLQQPAHDGPCVDGECICLDNRAPATAVPLADAATDPDRAIVCTLPPDAVDGRVRGWQEVRDRAVGRRPVPGGVAVQFPADPTLAATVTELAVAEHACCDFFRFTLHITADAVELEVTGPEGAQPVITSMFGPTAPTAAGDDGPRARSGMAVPSR